MVEVKSGLDRGFALSNSFGAGGVFGDLCEPLKSIRCRSNIEAQILGSGRDLGITPRRQMKGKPVRDFNV